MISNPKALHFAHCTALRRIPKRYSKYGDEILLRRNFSSALRLPSQLLVNFFGACPRGLKSSASVDQIVREHFLLFLRHLGANPLHGKFARKIITSHYAPQLFFRLTMDHHELVKALVAS